MDIWRDPYAQKVGTRGNSQDGLDIYGQEDSKGNYHGVQCTTLKNKAKRIKKLQDDVESAKSFSHKIKTFTFAYTDKNDLKLQEEARRLSTQNEAQGLFTVKVCSWEKICTLLNLYPRAAEIHLNVFPNPIGHQDNKMIAEMHAKIMGVDSISIDTETIEKDQDQRLDFARNLMKESSFQKALLYLSDLKKKLWDKATDGIKYKILTNMGACHHSIGSYEAAAECFTEAYSYNKDAISAQANYANALYLNGNKSEAKRIAKSILKKEANITACQILLSIEGPKKDLPQLEKLIPKELQVAPEVFHSLAMLAQTKGQIENSIKYLRQALEHTEDADMEGMLGSLLLEKIINERRFFSSDQLSKEMASVLTEAVACLTKAWEGFRTTDLATNKVMALLNLAQCHRFLRQTRQAIEALNDGLKVEPENEDLRKLLAIILFEDGEFENALEQFDKLSATKEDHELISLKVQCYYKLERGQDAVAFLDEIEREYAEKEFVLRRARIELLLDFKPDEAEPIILESLKKHPDSTEFLFYKAKLESQQGKAEESHATLHSIRNLDDSNLSKRIVAGIADLFYELEDYGASVPLYEQLADLATNSHFSQRLMRAYLHAEEWDKALKASQQVEAAVGATRFTAELQFRIYNAIGNIDASIQACDKYLEKEDDFRFKLMKSHALIRKGKFDEAKHCVEDRCDTSSLDLNEILNLASVLTAVGESRQAIELMYEAREKYYNEPSVHLRYTGLILMKEKDDAKWLIPEAVSVDTVVSIKSHRGEEKTFCIVSEERENLRESKFSTKHPLAQVVLNHKLGEEILIPDGLGRSQPYEIIDVKSKYIHAFQESMNEFNDLFPEHKGMIKLRLGGDSDQEDNGAAFVSQMEEAIRIIDSQSRRNETLENYKKSQIPIGILAKANGRNLIDTFSQLIAYRGVGPVYAIGSYAEREKALGRLRNNQNPILLDATSILSIFFLQIEGNVREAFDEICVTQSTIDEFQIYLIDEVTNASKESGVVGITDDGLLFQEISESERNERLKKLSAILEWIRNTCRIVPVYERLKGPNEHGELMRQCLGDSLLDTALVAKSGEYLHYCDDLFTRRVVQELFHRPAIWTQALLMHLVEKKLCSPQEYADKVIDLAVAEYHFTSVNDGVLLRFFEREKWKSDLQKFLQVCADMFFETTDKQGVDMVFCALLRGVWGRDVNILSKRRASFMIFNAMQKKAPPNEFAKRIVNVVGVAAYEHSHGQNIVNNFHEWREGHFLSKEWFLEALRQE